ncbi:putative porin [Paraburkholderia eburnea]|uniref:Putative porin n=1 Tax=Paraburkholderia eburnea TaxID=1189126 RepID=A0A2S4MJ69_9BURK|nr:porin [Paraburkholderia eburnea]POR54796.1 putative porin [Paraburkholderia eburnea]PRZ24605.1 putative porin [Paraburkholderia eburnea]
MKNTLIIAGVLSAFAVSAHAQSSVTLYGSLDAGIVYANNAGGHSAWNQGSGSLSDTYFGLKGSEDLGGGLHAVFTLENGFDLNNGKQAESNTMFNRQAFVGLQSDRFGTLTLGRQYDSMVDFLSPLSEAGAGYGNNLAAHPFDNDNLDHSFSIKNAVKYTSVNYAGFKFGGMYGFSNDAGQFSNNRAWSVGASYNNGPLNASAAYLQMNNAISQSNQSSGAVNAGNSNNFNLTAQTQRTMGAGVNYTYGPATVGFVWTHTQYENLLAGSQNGAATNFVVPTGTNLHLDNFELNGRYALTPALSLDASYTFTDGKLKSSAGSTDPKWQTASLQADYSLSKRTDVYVEGVYQHASGSFGDGRANVAMINTLSPSTTQNQVAATVGLRHRF